MLLLSYKMSRKLENIPYTSSGNPKHTLDIFLCPEKCTSNLVLVFIHGGAWRTGDKADYIWLGEGFSKLGLNTVNITYQLSTKDMEIIHPSHVKDCALALSYLYKNRDCWFKDCFEGFALVGHSAGNTMTDW